MEMVNLRKILAVCLLMIFTAGVFAGCNAKEAKVFQSLEDFTQAKIGVLTGSSFDLLATEYFPDAEKLYYMNITDLILNLKQNKINGVLMDMGLFTPLMWAGESLSYIEMAMPSTKYAVAFPKAEDSEPLKAQINTFIQDQTESGWLAELQEKWFSSSEPNGNVDFSQLTGENGTLRVATTIESKPFDYLKNGQFCGYDADFIFRFAQEYGYALEIDTMDFGALLPSLASGRYDLAISSITVTEERKESVLFSDIYCSCPIVMAVTDERVKPDAKQSLADLETATIGVITGSAHNGLVDKNFPEAKKINFNLMADMLLAVQQGKIDCYIEDAPFMAPLLWEGVAVKSVDEAVAQVTNGFVFPQGEQSKELREQINAFLAEAKADGTVDRLIQKWIGDTEPTEHPEYSQLTGENGTIHLAISVDNKPMLYQNAGGYTGLEMDLLTLFATEAGYAFDIEVVPFESIIAGISSGKYDMGASTLNITPEREESVDFSDPYAAFDVVMVIKNTDGQKAGMTLADFKNATIGVLTGSSYDALIKAQFPDAERKYYSLMTDLVLAVEQGKIDGYISEKPYSTAAIWEGARIAVVDEPLNVTDVGFIFQKDSELPLCEQMSIFIRNAKESGLLNELNEKWFGTTEPTEHPDYSALTGENGTIRIAVTSDLKPVVYYKDNAVTGYEMDILVHFAAEYGYKLDVNVMTFDAILPGITTGKYDIGSGGINITEERRQSVDFSESHMVVDIVMVTGTKEESEIKVSFFEGIKEDFEKTFIREDRWKLIVEGIGVTMLISICAALAGTLLGFGLYMLSRSDVKLLQLLAKGIAKVYSRIIAGTPVVVILMILFYVIFGKIRDMSGIVVAILGFTLTFGAFVYDHMTVSVGSVDRGQTEAAYALGYTKNQTFFRIIFPQAMTIFLPSYCGQAVELIKATAVVGYVAVNDLTKMGDIIRSNTYEAFFPLIATAVIHFLLTWILSVLLGGLKRRFEPKRRKKEAILKGVKTV